MRALLVIVALNLAGCATTLETTRPASACSTLVPDEWRAGVAHAQFPPPSATQGDFVDYADEESGNLDIANGRQKQTITIVERCEAHDAALVKALTRKPFLGLF